MGLKRNKILKATQNKFVIKKKIYSKKIHKTQPYLNSISKKKIFLKNKEKNKY
jgi:hypothetical protein